MAKQKREINEEFADVWSEIVSERVEVLKQKLMEETDEKKARYFDGYIDGMVETLTSDDRCDRITQTKCKEQHKLLHFIKQSICSLCRRAEL